MSKARIAVIGAGLMGHGIAQVFAVAGHDVTIADAAAASLDSVKARIGAGLNDLGDDPAAVDRVTPHREVSRDGEGCCGREQEASDHQRQLSLERQGRRVLGRLDLHQRRVRRTVQGGGARLSIRRLRHQEQRRHDHLLG